MVIKEREGGKSFRYFGSIRVRQVRDCTRVQLGIKSMMGGGGGGGFTYTCRIRVAAIKPAVMDGVVKCV